MAEIGFSFPTLVAVVAAFWLALLIRRTFFCKPLRLPPGPRPLPIVGNFFSMYLSGSKYFFGKWIDEYGPVATVWVCDRCIIVVSDVDMAQEALIGMGNQLASRQETTFAMKHLRSIGFRMMVTSPYGDYWRSARKNLASHVLTKGARTAMQPIREEEVARSMEALRAEAKEGTAGVDVRQHLRLTACAIFFRVCFGKRGDKATLEELNEALDVLFRALAFQLSDFLPFMAPFVRNTQKARLLSMVDKVDNIFGRFIAERRELRKVGQTAPHTYVDNVLVLQEEMGLSDNEVLSLLTELHFAGIDTTTGTMEWALGELTANPQVQEKLFQEITRVVGKRPVTEDDIPNLPYLKAVLQENFRKHPPLPSLAGHSPRGAGVKLAGYDIPEEAIVLILAKKIQNDPNVWSDPHMFKPERFLDSDGEFVDQMSISQGGKLKIFPFGAGRRICPGMSTGLTLVHFLLARLVQAFQFSPVDPQKGVDLTDTGGGLALFKTPLRPLLTNR